ncbi:MAG: hypothetical protein GY874_19120 [Desulfobacteraceae bacterium]|nr:hypothetical protein [Desulfobacteraceae bacterium]
MNKNEYTMISYMPFTFLPETIFCALRSVSSKIIVCQPVFKPMADPVQSLTNIGELEIKAPSRIDQDTLNAILAEYKHWASLHQGKAVDLAAFYKAMDAKAPLADENSPTQISSRIRNYGKTYEQPVDNPIYQAALFLCLAHEYDAIQYELENSLDSVSTIENQLYNRLEGDQAQSNHVLNTVSKMICKDNGLYMTDQRLQAWATLALSCQVEPSAFITDSRAVFEALLDKFSDAICLMQCGITDTGSGAGSDLKNQTLDEKLKQLSCARDLAFARQHADELDQEDNQVSDLTLYGLAGCSPQAFLSKIARGKESDTKLFREQHTSNTIFGLIN